MPASPDVENLRLGKGLLKWKGADDIDYRDLGEFESFSTNLNVTKKDYFSQRLGVRTKVRSIVDQTEMTCELVLNEWNADNLKLGLFGASDSSGVITIMGVTEIQGALRYVGTNAYGEKEQVDLPIVNFTPSGALDWVGDDWSKISLSGEVLAGEDGSFGLVHTAITEEIDD